MILATLLLAAIAQLPSTTALPKCEESVCVITAVSSATAQFQLGVGANGWCASTFTPKLPLTVSYPTNTYMCPAGDPAQNTAKFIVGVQQATSYTVTYSISGVVQPVFTVPALPPPLLLNCTGTLSMPTTSSGGTLSLSCK